MAEKRQVENPRFKDENVHALRFPEEGDIMCRDCALRAKDMADGTIKGSTLGVCDAFPIKPPSIILDGAECIYYISEDDAKD